MEVIFPENCGFTSFMVNWLNNLAAQRYVNLRVLYSCCKNHIPTVILNHIHMHFTRIRFLSTILEHIHNNYYLLVDCVIPFRLLIYNPTKLNKNVCCFLISKQNMVL